MAQSRIPGFHYLTRPERLNRIAHACDRSNTQLNHLTSTAAQTVSDASRIREDAARALLAED